MMRATIRLTPAFLGARAMLCDLLVRCWAAVLGLAIAWPWLDTTVARLCHHAIVDASTARLLQVFASDYSLSSPLLLQPLELLARLPSLGY
jgi:hypothetical protein